MISPPRRQERQEDQKRDAIHPTDTRGRAFDAQSRTKGLGLFSSLAFLGVLGVLAVRSVSD
jgi:hypothetical protein